MKLKVRLVLRAVKVSITLLIGACAGTGWMMAVAMDKPLRAYAAPYPAVVTSLKEAEGELLVTFKKYAAIYRIDLTRPESASWKAMLETSMRDHVNVCFEHDRDEIIAVELLHDDQ